MVAWHFDNRPPAGWYPDPAGGDGEAYWTGTDWGQPPTALIPDWLVTPAVITAFIGLIAAAGLVMELKPDSINLKAMAGTAIAWVVL